MEKSSRKKGRFVCVCMLIVMLALVTGCSQPDTTKNLARNVTITIATATSRTIMPQEYPTPSKYTISLTSKTSGISSPEPVDVAHNAEGETFASIPQVMIGSYTLNVDAYIDEAKTKKIFTGSSDIVVTANGDNEFQIALSVISTATEETDTGTVVVEFDWSRTDRTVTDIELLISDGSEIDGVLQFISGGTVVVGSDSSSLRFSKEVSVGKNQYAMFKLWNGVELIGETGVESLHVFLNMDSTPTVAKNYVFTEADFQPAENVKQVSVTSVSDGSAVGLKIDWTNPAGCDHQVITWCLGGSSDLLGRYTTSTSAESTYTISGLTVNTEYVITITTYYESGLISPAVTLVKTTAVPVASVSLAGIPVEEQMAFTPGSSYQLVPVVTSSISGYDATDLGYNWLSSDESIAKVMSDGSIVAQKAGAAQITVTTINGNKSASVDVTVHLSVPTVTAVAEPDGIHVAWKAVPNTSTYELKRADGTVLQTLSADASATVTYKDTALISGNSYSYLVQAKASTEDGIVLDSAVSAPSTAITPAQPTISITLPTVASDLEDPTKNLAFADAKFNLVAGDPALTISITPVSDAVSYQWMLNTTRLPSTTEPYITVIDENTAGLNKDRQDNTLTLFVSNEKTTYSAQTKLYYIAVKDTGVEYTGGTTIKTTDGAVQLTADVTPSDASIQTVKWSLVNAEAASGICTLTEDGLFRALDTGSVEVMMTTHSGATNTATINCVVPVKGVTIQPTTAQGQHFVNGQNGYGEVTLAAVVESATEGKEATNQSVTWSSSNSNVATVDVDGKVTPVGAGTATITVKTNDGAKSAEYAITVIKPRFVDSGNNDLTKFLVPYQFAVARTADLHIASSGDLSKYYANWSTDSSYFTTSNESVISVTVKRAASWLTNCTITYNLYADSSKQILIYTMSIETIK